MSALLIDGTRTPFLKVGSVPNVNTIEMGLTPIKEILNRYPGIVNEIDCVIGANIGNQILPPGGSNLPRILAAKAGIPYKVPAWSVNINCASGLHALIDAVRQIEMGEANVVLVTAVEVMSDYTLVLSREQRALYEEMVAASRMKQWWKKLPKIIKSQWKIRSSSHQPFFTKDFGHEPLWMIKLGLTDPISGLDMGQIGNKIAQKFDISREEQDLFAWESQRRATNSQKAGKFDDEITPFRGISSDNGVRPNQELEKLAKLRPLQKNGTVTAGNSSQVTDGACALLVTSEDFAKAHGLTTLVNISSRNSATVGCDPSLMGIGPVFAIQKLLAKTSYALTDFDIIETNEAFASVVIAQNKILSSKKLCEQFGIKGPIGSYIFDKTNVNGGAIGIGHPISATGARLALTCALELNHQDAERGLVTLCVGGGQGQALILERR